VVTSTKYWLSASPVPQEDWQRRWSQVDQMLASRNMELADERAKLRAAEEHVYKLQQELRVRTEHPVTTLIGDSRPLKFSLLTDEYCSMVGSRESEYTTTSRPLISKTFVAALHEAEALFVRLDRYEVQVWDKSRQMYPQNPRLVAQMEVE
jgi:hypothetical protein